MSETKKTIHPRMAEAIANAEKAAVSNRGMYPHTKACNVFQGSGERMEELPSDETGNDSEENDKSSSEPNSSPVNMSTPANNKASSYFNTGKPTTASDKKDTEESKE